MFFSFNSMLIGSQRLRRPHMCFRWLSLGCMLALCFMFISSWAYRAKEHCHAYFQLTWCECSRTVKAVETNSGQPWTCNECQFSGLKLIIHFIINKIQGLACHTHTSCQQIQCNLRLVIQDKILNTRLALMSYIHRK